MLIQSVNSGELIDVNMEDENDRYPSSFDYAKSNGELTQFWDSYHQDIRCGAAIDGAINEHFDGSHLSSGVLKPVLEEFCPERISHVLADTIIYEMSDLRISRPNTQWARQINPEQEPNTYEDHLIILQSHPYVLDGFIDMFRKELDHIKEVSQEDPAKANQDIQDRVPEYFTGRSR